MNPQDRSKVKKKRAKNGGFTRDAELQVVAKQAAKKLSTKAQMGQLQTIADPLTHQDLAIAEYLTTLTDPWVETPAGVPLIIGNMCRRTVKAQLHGEVTVVANASGFGFFAMNCDGWVADAGAVATRYASYSGGTQGYPMWYTNASYVGTSFPAYNATTATTGLLAVQLTLLDGQVVATSNVRMVAAGIRVFSDAAVNTAQGKLAVVATSKPYTGSAATGQISSSSYATLSQMPQDVVSFQAEPAAGWKSGHKLHAVAIPADPDCWSFFNPPATGSAQFNYPQLAAVLSGGASGQTFTVQWVMDYEFDVGVTNVTGIDSDPIIGTSVGDLSGYMSTMGQMSNVATGAHNVGSSVGGLVSGKGPEAYVQHLALTRPTKIPAIAAVAKNEGGILAKIGGLASSAFNWVKNSGIVKALAPAISKVPYVGPALGALASMFG